MASQEGLTSMELKNAFHVTKFSAASISLTFQKLYFLKEIYLVSDT
jgi:hypothetical protein